MFNINYFKPRLEMVQKTERFSPEELGVFFSFLKSAPDEELFRMSPLRYADKQGMDTHKAVDLFLHMTHVGILNFSWGILCPSCGAFLSTESGLRWLHSKQNCTVCMIPGIEPSIDENVEVAFTISSLVRSIRFHDLETLDFEEDGIFVLWSTSVALYPEVHQMLHDAIFGSQRVEAGETETLELELEANHYFFMIPETHCVGHVHVDDTGAGNELDLEIMLDGHIVPEYSILAPGQGIIRVHNRTNRNIVLGLLKDPRIKPTPFEERSHPISPLFTLSPYLTGKQITSNQTFRELFRSESIPAASGLEFKNLTLLFTDLTDSTAMYGRVGDINAYTMVREHFALLRGVVVANGGAIVKTMGDAIMASFAEPDHALAAAVTMHQQIRKTGGAEKLRLKIGIHVGSCIAVDQNDKLDYFGQTINVAARVQHLANAEEIVITEPVHANTNVQSVIKRHKLKVAQDQALLKGVDGLVIVYRLKK